MDRTRVATLNLLYYPQGSRWRERRPLVEATLRALAPDVICLQEVDRSTDQDHLLALAAGEALAYQVYRASETIRPRYPRHWDGVVILARENAGAIRFHEVRRLTYHRAVHALGLSLRDGSTMTVANTHLHHPHDASGRAMRLRQAQMLLRFLDGLPRSDATILAGDLNALPDEPAVSRLLEAGFRSVAREAGMGDVATFPSGLIAPTISLGPASCIDYILVRGDAIVDRAALAFHEAAAHDPSLYPSDHRGLFADLSLPPKRTVTGPGVGSARTHIPPS